MQSLIHYMQDHRWNLLIIIHYSFCVSEYGSCITAQRLCVGHSPPLKYDTIRQPSAHGHSGFCKKLWNQAATDLCPCGEKQTMSHIVASCPLTKLNGGLSQLHSADDEAIAWLTNYGSWCLHKKEKCFPDRTWKHAPSCMWLVIFSLKVTSHLLIYGNALSVKVILKWHNGPADCTVMTTCVVLHVSLYMFMCIVVITLGAGGQASRSDEAVSWWSSGHPKAWVLVRCNVSPICTGSQYTTATTTTNIVFTR